MKQTKISYEEYQGLIAKICRDITLDDWKPDYIVGITRGGMPAAVMISHYFNIKCYALNLSLSQDPPFTESNCWMADDAFGIEGSPQKILVVDDINDQGTTLNWIVEDWQSSCRPDSKQWDNIWGNTVRFAAVIDNLSSKFTHQISYSGMSINKAEKDEWIVFPYEEWWK
jgi:hypoxanthine phosphoribosyltransferase